MGMTDVVKVLIYSLADVNHANFGADLLGDDNGVGLRPGRSAEAGERAGDDIGSRQAHLLDGHRADHDSESGIHSAGDADHTVVKMCILHAFDKAGDLDIQHTAAISRELIARFRKVGMHEISPGEGGFGEVFTPAEAEIV